MSAFEELILALAAIPVWSDLGREASAPGWRWVLGYRPSPAISELCSSCGRMFNEWFSLLCRFAQAPHTRSDPVAWDLALCVPWFLSCGDGIEMKQWQCRVKQAIPSKPERMLVLFFSNVLFVCFGFWFGVFCVVLFVCVSVWCVLLPPNLVSCNARDKWIMWQGAVRSQWWEMGRWGSLQIQGLHGRMHLPAGVLPPGLCRALWCHPPATAGWLIWQRQQWSWKALYCRCVRYRTGFKGAVHKRSEAGAWQISQCFKWSQHAQAALGRYMCVSEVCAFFQ